MKKSKLIDKEFNKWMVIGEDKNKWGNIIWKRKCGQIGYIETTKLTRGLSEECGGCSRRQFYKNISGH